jgi:endonuclease/exonuclease/phosphatase (EEP) superfamily protein YafD
MSIILLAVVTGAYSLRNEHVAALTMLPTWLWLLPGLLLTLDAYRQRRFRRYAGIVTLLWGLFLAVYVDELPALLRGLTPEPTASSSLRVVSLNCAGGSEAAANETAAYRPDIVLLQESPSRAEVERVTKRLYGDTGGCVVGLDASILARGTVEPIPVPPSLRMHAVAARVTVPGHPAVHVISLRLPPPVARVDLWNPENWRLQAADFRERRILIQAFKTFLRELLERPGRTPLLVGGDFNAPGRDGTLDPLGAAGIQDAFRQAGRGFGNTITNEMPFHRIDLLFTNPKRLRPLTVTAHRTENSDHRLVAGTFAFSAL